MFGSTIDAVRKFASGPECPGFPAYPQWIGNPICQTVFPSIFIGRSRFVTVALPTMRPRALETAICSLCAIPFSCANSSGSSKKNVGSTSLSRGLCCVQ